MADTETFGLGFLCPYTETDAICFACVHGDHDEHDQYYSAYGRKWKSTCCSENDD